MKLEKIILCVAVALTAFGTSLGLLEIGSYFRAAFQPLRVEIKPLEPFESPVYAPARLPELKQPAFTPTAKTEAEAEPEDWGEDGYYYIVDGQSKGFSDFEWFELNTYKFDEKYRKIILDKPSGGIRTEKGNFELASIKTTGKRISIVTETQKGISYRFEGKFIDKEEVKYKDEDGEEYTDEAVLKGRLTKWRNGVKIAEANVKLGYTVGC